MRKKITHLTSAHPRYDTRIFIKMCSSLANNGFDISLIVADGKGDETKSGVKIVDVGSSRNRLFRILRAPNCVFKKALALDSDIYHLHDPELLPIGLKLKKCGKTVIFDSHEDIPKQMLTKPYLNKSLLKLLSFSIKKYEAWVCKQLDGVITATPFIREKFLKINPNSIDINNFPILVELSTDVKWKDKKKEVCYVGGIDKIRGIKELIQAMGKIKNDVKLNLCGVFSNKNTEKEVKAQSGWRQVLEHGFINRQGVREILTRSIAGLVTFYPLPNHIDAQPNKMFEYMSAGIPVIASNFPLWREIIGGNNCGICVDPMKPKEIAEAIDYFINHPKQAEIMGNNGRIAVEQKYNWETEKEKLVGFYKVL